MAAAAPFTAPPRTSPALDTSDEALEEAAEPMAAHNTGSRPEIGSDVEVPAQIPGEATERRTIDQPTQALYDQALRVPVTTL